MQPFSIPVLLLHRNVTEAYDPLQLNWSQKYIGGNLGECIRQVKHVINTTNINSEYLPKIIEWLLKRFTILLSYVCLIYMLYKSLDASSLKVFWYHLIHFCNQCFTFIEISVPVPLLSKCGKLFYVIIFYKFLEFPFGFIINDRLALRKSNHHQVK